MFHHLTNLYQVIKQIFGNVFEFQQNKSFTEKQKTKFLVSLLQLGDMMQRNTYTTVAAYMKRHNATQVQKIRIQYDIQTNKLQVCKLGIQSIINI